MGTSNNNPLINKPRADTFPLSLKYISAAERSVLRNMAVGFEVVSSNSSPAKAERSVAETEFQMICKECDEMYVCTRGGGKYAGGGVCEKAHLLICAIHGGSCDMLNTSVCVA
jgi:Zn finger protein HypA/HybF involved in hydrogenase expression